MSEKNVALINKKQVLIFSIITVVSAIAVIVVCVLYLNDSIPRKIGSVLTNGLLALTLISGGIAQLGLKRRMNTVAAVFSFIVSAFLIIVSVNTLLK